MQITNPHEDLHYKKISDILCDSEVYFSLLGLVGLGWGKTCHTIRQKYVFNYDNKHNLTYTLFCRFLLIGSNTNSEKKRLQFITFWNEYSRCEIED